MTNLLKVIQSIYHATSIKYTSSVLFEGKEIYQFMYFICLYKCIPFFCINVFHIFFVVKQEKMYNYTAVFLFKYLILWSDAFKV